MNTEKLLSATRLYLKRNAPTILSCAGAVGVVLTAITAANASLKAMYNVDEVEWGERRTLNKKEAFLVAAPAYIPTVLVGSATIACIFGANLLNQRQQSALVSAYMLLDTAFKDYKAKTAQLYGEDADQKIRSEIVKDKYKDAPVVVRSDETMLFYEEHYGHIFERTMLEVQDAEYQLNRKLAKDGEVSLNDFYRFLGLNENEIGDALGWSQECICDFYTPAWIDFEHELVTLDDGMECYIINILVSPVAGYDVPF